MILEAKNLTIGYSLGKSELQLLKNAQFRLQKGFVYSVFGANGIGKSTLIHTICGIIPPLKGEILINNQSIAKIPKKDLAKQISIVLTDRPHVEFMKVYDFVALGRTPHTGFSGYLNGDDHKIVEESMAMTAIEHKKHQRIDSLSDGEFQKALIARALTQQTPIIIMDEPASYLDYANQIQLMTLLQKLAKQSGKTILLSLHHINLAIDYSNIIMLFNNDLTLTIGAPEDLIVQNKFNSIYVNKEIFFDNFDGYFKNSNALQATFEIDAPPLQKKWINHALVKSGITSLPFSIKYDNGYYSILQNTIELETVTTIAKLIEKLKELDY
jgi:iron complex transport system ATP-binding protein